MYGSYSRNLARRSAAIESDLSATSRAIATLIRQNGGRVTTQQLGQLYAASEIERAVELDRTIHPVTFDTIVGLVTYYEAN